MSNDPFGTSSGDAEAEAFLTGGSSLVAAKWPTVGAKVEGTVTDWQFPVQKTDMDTGELMFFEGKKLVKESELKRPESARPAMQMLIDLQCEATGITWKSNQYIKETVEDDDGMRRAYVSGELQKAIGDALKEAGAALEKGAYLQVVRTDPKKTPSGFFAYTYKAKWTKAADNTKAANTFLNTADADPFATS